MEEGLFKILSCIRCSHMLEYKGGSLMCPSCGAEYPIIDNIPRLVPESLSVDDRKTADSFGWEWTVGWDKSVFDSDKIDEERETKVFIEKTDMKPLFFRDKLVLDAGCGFGRYSYVARKFGAKVVSVDLSKAVESAYKNLEGFGEGLIIQADLFNLPFRENTFDYIFSLGVLHHTPDTKRAFQTLVKFLKPGGTISIWVYRKNSPEREYVFDEIRKITLELPYPTLYKVAQILALLAQSQIIKDSDKNRIPISNLVHNNFDWYSCPIRHHHTEDEVESWFREMKLNNIKIYGWIHKKYGGAIGAKGTK